MDVVSLETDDVPVSCVAPDICVVGAGAAGLYLAKRLDEAGLSVVVLEAGPKASVSPEEAGFEAEFGADVYQGAVDGRAFGIGGTTSRWGGQLVAFNLSDAAREDVTHGDAWAHVLRTIDRCGDTVAAALGSRHDEDGPRGGNLSPVIRNAVAKAGLAAVASRWLPFTRRNFRWMVHGAHGRRSNVTIVCDAVATGWRLKSAGGLCRVAGVEATSASGRRLLLEAGSCVIAAGGIESPRILQEIDSGGGRVIPRGVAVGHYLSDHLSFKIGEVRDRQRRISADTFGPFFEHGQMRTWRFMEASPDPAAPRSFAHFLFTLDNPGFNLARTALLDLQARRLPTFGLGDILSGGAGLAQLAWSRGVRSRLFIPEGTQVGLQLDMEQRPVASNRVTLGQARDRYGRSVARVDWRISSSDRSDMAIATRNFLSAWSRSVPELPDILPVVGADAATKPHGAYHPAGTCRLGSDAGAVVDHGLKVRGTSNLHVLSTGIFPSAGTANPTFGLLCMAEMLADKLKKELRT